MKNIYYIKKLSHCTLKLNLYDNNELLNKYKEGYLHETGRK